MSDDVLPEPTHLAAIVELTVEALASHLQLPPGAYIDFVHAPIDQPGRLVMRIRGAGWPVNVGSLIPRTTAIVSMSFDGEGRELSRKIDWRFPSHPVEGPPE